MKININLFTTVATWLIMVLLVSYLIVNLRKAWDNERELSNRINQQQKGTK